MANVNFSVDELREIRDGLFTVSRQLAQLSATKAWQDVHDGQNAVDQLIELLEKQDDHRNPQRRENHPQPQSGPQGDPYDNGDPRCG